MCGIVCIIIWTRSLMGFFFCLLMRMACAIGTNYLKISSIRSERLHYRMLVLFFFLFFFSKKQALMAYVKARMMTLSVIENGLTFSSLLLCKIQEWITMFSKFYESLSTRLNLLWILMCSSCGVQLFENFAFSYALTTTNDPLPYINHHRANWFW